MLWLTAHAGYRPKRLFCTMMASRILTASAAKHALEKVNGLDACLRRVLGSGSASDESASDWGTRVLTRDQLVYAASDVRHLQPLRVVMNQQIRTAGMDRMRDLEIALIPSVVEMELSGMSVDKGRLQEPTMRVSEGSRSSRWCSC